MTNSGTDKTYASAFAMRELGFKRVLFLVHRGQLARQTKKAYENVFDKSISMGLVGAGEYDYDCDYVFTTIQTLNQDAHLFKCNKIHTILCGLDNQKLLKASHIKPWSKSDDIEKLDVNNGILLCAMHDNLFDCGLISFDDSGNLLMSKQLSEKDKDIIGIANTQKIRVYEGNIPYLEYHRETIFDK